MKGRNPRLIQLRNEYLIKRYYYWHELMRTRRDDTIKTLSECELFLDEEYIKRIIYANSDLLKQIKRRRPTEKQLSTFVFESEENSQHFVSGNLFASVS